MPFEAWSDPRIGFDYQWVLGVSQDDPTIVRFKFNLFAISVDFFPTPVFGTDVFKDSDCFVHV